MAKNKKRKKPSKTPHSSHTGFKHSQSYLETCYATAKRIIRAVGEDETLFDAFTKRQKKDLFRITITPPYVAAKRGHKVPKPFLRYIQENLTDFMRLKPFNEEHGVSYMDIVTVGQCLLLSFDAEANRNYLPSPQIDIVKHLLDVFHEKHIFADSQLKVVGAIRISLMSLSQPNFRIYGLDTVQPEALIDRPVVQQMQYITTHECQKLHFTHHGKEHLAYRIFLAPISEFPSAAAYIPKDEVIPGARHEMQMDIYIQAHALHRLKERVDAIYPVIRNQYIYLSLMCSKTIRGADGKLYIPYFLPETNVELHLGYFAFTVKGNNLIVLTFLPLFSQRVPEGKILSERLQLSQEDVTYLGMDRLSFFFDVDIDQIPALKKVLFDELHLEYIRDLYKTFCDKDQALIGKRTSFVKNFFSKIETNDIQPDHGEE
ncbi:MAG: hypothetical protein LBS05_08430 [Tannerellaceae bacterium]|jgi:hypothetical protein|nr:hypothetical protein [Tannerellaceae bacterium]